MTIYMVSIRSSMSEKSEGDSEDCTISHIFMKNRHSTITNNFLLSHIQEKAICNSIHPTHKANTTLDLAIYIQQKNTTTAASLVLVQDYWVSLIKQCQKNNKTPLPTTFPFVCLPQFCSTQYFPSVDTRSAFIQPEEYGFHNQEGLPWNYLPSPDSPLY